MIIICIAIGWIVLSVILALAFGRAIAKADEKGY